MSFNLSQLSIALIALMTTCSASLPKSLVSQDANELLNWCLDSKHHKKQAGSEPLLTGECRPWRAHSCCSKDIADAAHFAVNHYKFDVNHCAHRTGRNMSASCRRFFTRDTCFFDCEPSLGPWVVKTNRTFARERMMNVPLCASECDSWYEACRDDYTCATNWPKNLIWKNDRSECKQGSECRTIGEIYASSKDFCETVWDSSWKYTPDIEPCMKISFDYQANPNKKVAQYYLQTEHGYEFSSAHSNFLSTALIFIILGTVLRILF
ncbi:Folate receptor alpha [Halotydeus destructor]|nr:Folate receptor alpha [Halotydeus destructor]